MCGGIEAGRKLAEADRISRKVAGGDSDTKFLLIGSIGTGRARRLALGSAGSIFARRLRLWLRL